jgi:aspartyl protease family protein
MPAGFWEPQTVVWIVMLLLVGSALFSQRMRASEFFRNLFIWAGIFLVVYGIALFRNDIRVVWDRARADFAGEADQRSSGSAMLIQMADDGHFWVAARVNGRDVRFLIDSGASATVFGRGEAARLGVVSDVGSFPVALETANGTLMADRATVNEMAVGTIVSRDVPVLISQRDDPTNVLGMSWLSRLAAWRVEGRTLRLEPQGGGR